MTTPTQPPPVVPTALFHSAFVPYMFGKGADLFQCECACHKEKGGFKHFDPCCESAPCRMNVEIGYMEMHMAVCQACAEIAQEAGR